MFYLIVGLISLIIFFGISKSGQAPQPSSKNLNPKMVGKDACDFILSYLNSIKMENISPLVMTELFAFVYYEIDCLLFLRKISARETITNSVASTYDTVISKLFPALDLEYAQAAFDERVAEYAAMTRANEEKSEIINRFNFNFSHAKKGVHYKHSETPIVIGNIFDSFEEKISANSFYLSYMAPFMQKIVADFS